MIITKDLIMILFFNHPPKPGAMLSAHLLSGEVASSHAQDWCELPHHHRHYHHHHHHHHHHYCHGYIVLLPLKWFFLNLKLNNPNWWGILCFSVGNAFVFECLPSCQTQLVCTWQHHHYVDTADPDLDDYDDDDDDDADGDDDDDDNKFWFAWKALQFSPIEVWAWYMQLLMWAQLSQSGGSKSKPKILSSEDSKLQIGQTNAHSQFHSSDCRQFAWASKYNEGIILKKRGCLSV